jgi:hypothetical protein
MINSDIIAHHDQFCDPHLEPGAKWRHQESLDALFAEADDDNNGVVTEQELIELAWVG